jgi:hypothetical protein
MTETTYRGTNIASIISEAEGINDFNSIRFWVKGEEILAEDLKMVVYQEEEEIICLTPEGKKMVFSSYYPVSVKATQKLLNTGSKLYFVKEYKEGEYGIYDENDKLLADSFKSIEHAQQWYDKEVEYNKKLKSLNDAIFATLEEDENSTYGKCKKIIEAMAENACAKSEIIDFRESIVFFTFDTKGYIEYKVYRVINENENILLDSICDTTTSLKYAFDIYMKNIVSAL